MPTGPSIAPSVCLAVVCLAASLPASASSTQGAQGGSANHVRLDLYATDSGREVDDLQAADLEVLEDGVRQTIETFRRVGSPPRYIVFLDTYHLDLDSTPRLRLAIARFLDRLAGSDDEVALMTPRMPIASVSFGPKSEAISSLMQADWTWGSGPPEAELARERRYAECYPPADRGSRSLSDQMRARRRESLTIDALEGLAAKVARERTERAAVLVITSGWQVFAPDARLAARPGGRRGIGTERPECEADRIALADIDHVTRLRRLTEAANRATTSFYTVHAPALADGDGDGAAGVQAAGSGDLSARLDGLRQLATATDGTAILQPRDVDEGLRRIAADMSAYYLIVYSPTNAQLDGKLRRISVRSARTGVRIRTRREYRALTPEELFDGLDDDTAADSVVPRGPGRPPFRIRTSAWVTRDGEPSGAVWITGELDYATRIELVWTAGATAEVTMVAADGSEVFSGTSDVSAADGSFAFRVPDAGGLRPGEYAVRVRIRPAAEPELSVGDTARVILQAGEPPLGEAVLWRRGPSTGPRFVRTAEARYRRNERLRMELPTAVPGTVAGRMLDRAGNPLQVPVQVSDREDESEQFRWVVVEVSLAPLAAGEYGIEVTLDGARRVTLFRVVP